MPAISTGCGFAQITIDTATDQVCVDLSTFTNVDDLILMHIHRGAAGVNGPIVVDFARPRRVPGRSTSACSSGAVDRRDRGEPAQLLPERPHDTVPVPARSGSAPTTCELLTLSADTRSGVRLTAAELARHPGARVELDHRRRPVRPAGALGSLPPGATAALVNITATDVRAAGFATVYSNALATVPAASTINWNGHDVAITTTVKVDSTGSVKVTIGPDGGTDLIIDVIGYLSSGAA